MKFLFGLTIGGYIMGAVLTFLFVGALVVLGGDSSDLWKPFAYAAAGPLGIPLFLLWG